MLKHITSWRPVQVLVAYGQSQGGNYAASLSFNAFLAMFPLILGMLAIVGFVVNDPRTMRTVQTDIASIFPSDARPQVLQVLQYGASQRRAPRHPVRRRAALERDQPVRLHGVRAHHHLWDDAARHAPAARHGTDHGAGLHRRGSLRGGRQQRPRGVTGRGCHRHHRRGDRARRAYDRHLSLRPQPHVRV